jgi:Na+(H+)/acetate symporter ActP
VVLVGAVITLNVALGGMKGITLVQAFQYWAKMFAISVPIFVLMAVYGHYGKQLDVQGAKVGPLLGAEFMKLYSEPLTNAPSSALKLQALTLLGTNAKRLGITQHTIGVNMHSNRLDWTLMFYGEVAQKDVYALLETNKLGAWIPYSTNALRGASFLREAKNYLSEQGIVLVSEGEREVRFASTNLLQMTWRHLPEKAPSDQAWLNPFGPLTTKAAKAAKLSAEESKPYSLLYTYSLIIAIVCGTAGLPHILVRFYTNPDGVAAKRTTMWVMILIGVFYLFPPVFGVMGRNLLPELYNGIGAKGTDKVVLELPRILNEVKVGKWESEKVGAATNSAALSPAHSPTFPPATPLAPKSSGIPWGSILSGITCAGAFAAFMSTFSGLLVSMTGALAHDVYGRMLNPKATPAQRMKMFKWCAVLIGGVAVLLGSQVEPLEINFMVGQAFAIAAASYFPLLFMAVWWRKLTMKGAATGMLAGGTSAVVAISLTSFSTLAASPGRTGELFAAFKPLNTFWAGHPLLRILCEQPAIWAVPMAITLMFVVSKLTKREVPPDIRMKMLVLHAPEELGLKQEYIQEHQHGH